MQVKVMLTGRKMQVTKVMLQQLPSWSIRSGVWLHYWEMTSTGTCGMSIMTYDVVEAEGRECEHLRSKWSGTEEEREKLAVELFVHWMHSVNYILRL
jgi:hypothetical protein